MGRPPKADYDPFSEEELENLRKLVMYREVLYRSDARNKSKQHDWEAVANKMNRSG